LAGGLVPPVRRAVLPLCLVEVAAMAVVPPCADALAAWLLLRVLACWALPDLQLTKGEGLLDGLQGSVGGA
jgi:hypothetical protein